MIRFSRGCGRGVGLLGEPEFLQRRTEPEILIIDSRAVFRFLCDHRACPERIPDETRPGVYAIFAQEPECLPGIAVPQSGLLYIGLSGDLAKRNHFEARHSGFSSPRRSLGAVLKRELGLSAEPRSAGRSPTNYANYRFGGDGETRLSEWMRRSLTCAIYVLDGNPNILERRLIEENEPPLNLTGWPNPQKPRIQSLRSICKEEARLVWSASG